MTFGERLRALREKRDMTRDELAIALGVSYSAIAKYESGDRDPDFHLLKKMATFFRVSVDYLIGMPETEPTSQEILFPEESQVREPKFQYYVKPRESVLAQLTPQERETYLDMCRSKTSPFRGRQQIGPNGMDDEMVIALIRVFEYVKDYDDKTGRVPRKRTRKSDPDGNE